MDQYGLKRKGKRAIFYSTAPPDQTDCVEEMSQCTDNQFRQAHILQTSNLQIVPERVQPLNEHL